MRAAIFRPLAGLLALGVLVQPAAADTTLNLGYQAWSGGVAVLDTKLQIQSDADSYRADLEAVLTGPPAWFTDYRLTVQAEGALGAEGPVPTQFRQQSDDNDERKWLALAWADDGQPVVTGDPSPEKERRGREPIDPSELQGARDPLSAIMALLLESAVRGDCEVSAQVFDGKRRFDVVVHDKGETVLPKSRFNFYSGPARACELTLVPVAGYKLNGKDRRNFPEQVLVHVAEVKEGLPPVPVRVETKIEYGAILLHLVSVN